MVGGDVKTKVWRRYFTSINKAEKYAEADYKKCRATKRDKLKWRRSLPLASITNLDAMVAYEVMKVKVIS